MPSEPGTNLRVGVTGDYIIDGIAIHIGYRADHASYWVKHFAADGTSSMSKIEATQNADPSLRLNNEEARALLDALLRHYQGSGDYHTLREDYLHERRRVDALIASISIIATAETVDAVG